MVKKGEFLLMKAKYCLRIDLINAVEFQSYTKVYRITIKNIMRFTHQKYLPGLLQAMLNFPTALPAIRRKNAKKSMNKDKKNIIFALIYNFYDIKMPILNSHHHQSVRIIITFSSFKSESGLIDPNI